MSGANVLICSMGKKIGQTSHKYFSHWQKHRIGFGCFVSYIHHEYYWYVRACMRLLNVIDLLWCVIYDYVAAVN